MADVELMDKLIDESFKAPEMSREELLDLIARMRDCMDEGVLMNAEEIAQELRCSGRTIYRYVSLGMPVVYRPHQMMFYLHEVHQWIKDGANRPRPYNKEGKK